MVVSKVELQLRERVQTNVQSVLARLNDVSLAKQSGDGGHTAPNQKVHALIEAATDSKNLCTMNTAWLPWV